GKRKLSLILIRSIIFSNQGAQQGCIADLAAVLQVPVTTDEKKLRAYQFLNSEKLFQVIRTGRPIHEAYEAFFTPVAILGKQQVSKTILFRYLNFDPKDLKEGTYMLGIVGSTCNAPDVWMQFLKSTYVLDRDRVADLIRGQATVFES